MIRRALVYLRATRLDLDLAGYAAMVAALVLALAVTTGLIGPTLDHHDEIANDSRGGKTAYAAKD